MNRKSSARMPGYAELLTRGVDLDALLGEHLAATGPDGIRALAEAVNRIPMPLTQAESRRPLAPATSHTLVETVGALEALDSALYAKQAEYALAYEESLAADRKASNVRIKNPGWGAGAEIALALHLSPREGTGFTNTARLLVNDFPHTLDGLRTGALTRKQARVVAGACRELRQDTRRLIDGLLWEDTHNCFAAGTQKLKELISYWAKILEATDQEDSEAKARKERGISLWQVDAHRVRLSGLLPLEQGAAIAQVLAREVDRARSRPGEDRNQGQLRADILYESLTGLRADGGIPVNLGLVMSAETFTGESLEPVLIPGHGYLSAARGRELLAGKPEETLRSWVRSLWMDAQTGNLVAMGSKARRFTGNLKKQVMVRDQYCRTPYCNGKIEDIDHVVQVRRNGETSADNASARCKRCNQTKEAPGWVEVPVPGERHTIKITTPSGHSYLSVAPPLPGFSNQAILRVRQKQLKNRARDRAMNRLKGRSPGAAPPTETGPPVPPPPW